MQAITAAWRLLTDAQERNSQEAQGSLSASPRGDRPDTWLTEWVGSFPKAHLPASIYGVVAVGAAIAYGILVQAIIRANGRDSAVGLAVGSDRKGNLSIALYAAGVGLAWVSPWIAYGLYLAVAVVWFVPDRRFARARRDPADPARRDIRPL